MKPDLLGLPRAELSAFLNAQGVGAQHTNRLIGGLHRRGLALDAIPDLGRHADRLAEISTLAQATVHRAAPMDPQDPAGVEKLVVQLADGAQVEAVLIPMRADRTTLCVSSQVGCGMGCTFCATGYLGLSRGLTAGEILAQIYAACDHAEAHNRRVSHLVFMGMGEPLHHYAATRDALKLLRDPAGRCFKARHLTVSTVGVVPRMHELARDFEGRIQLALSLHAGTDETRKQIIPMAGRYSLADLKETLLAWPLPGTRVLMLEYVVLPGVNDTDEELAGLALFADGLRALVNLIPFNPFPQAPFRSPTEAEIDSLSTRLSALGVPNSVRRPRGRDVDGACGQLALRERSAP